MRTFKRNTADIDTTGIKNYSKYFNQMNFKGILEDDNIYAIDQESFTTAKNVYLDDNDRLASRPTLQKDNIPDEIDVYQYDLEDVKYIGQNTIYINKSKVTDRYYILLVDKDGNKHSIQPIPDYLIRVELEPNTYVTVLKSASGELRLINTSNCVVDKYANPNVSQPNAFIVTRSDDKQDWTVWFTNIELLNVTFNIYNGDSIASKDLISTKKVNIPELNKYHISSIEHYIICWNNIGAKVFDASDSAKGWQDFSEFVEIPIIKTVVGTTETKLANNEFTTQYKEQYIYSEQKHPVLPNGNASVEVFTSSADTLKYDVENAKNYTDYKIFKEITIPNVTEQTIFGYNSETGKHIIGIVTTNKVYISFNGGQAYTVELYPEELTNIKASGITDDGLYCYFLTTTGIFFLNLGDFTWSSDEFNYSYNSVVSYCFKTKQIYSFLVVGPENYPEVRLYFKGPTLYSGTDYTDDNKLTYVNKIKINYQGSLVDSNINTIYEKSYIYTRNSRINMFQTKNNLDEDIWAITVLIPASYESDILLLVLGGKNMYDAAYPTPKTNSGMLSWGQSISIANTSIISCTLMTPSSNSWVVGYSISVIGDTPTTTDDTTYWHHWKKGSIDFEMTTINSSDGTNYRPNVSINSLYSSLPEIPNDYYIFPVGSYMITPIRLAQGYIYRTISNKIYFIPDSGINVLELSEISSRLNYVERIDVKRDKYFIVSDNASSWKLYTNLLVGDDLATLTYLYGEKTEYNKVPKVSYSDTELYLAFDDLLQITANSRNNEDKTKISFNLPDSNNQSFIDDITGMINISTTEVALFFLNKIVICSKVQDSNLAQGYRYDYYNTKLSTGIRLGDSILNTLEGQYTIFPTKRGLAVMNYQAFMATTDQVIQYISDSIKTLWTEFYNNSTAINIIQWRNRLIFTNQSNIILLYDLDKSAWWKWEVPINVKLAITDQIDLRVIDTNLNLFKDSTQYYDFGEVGQFKPIDWFIMSQPLHMNTPNHYKNLRQLVFQFSNNNEDDITSKTINAQIKLYRKRISIKEPETIQFQIENLRTFVKRFNYWKINEIQWALGNDADTDVPKKFELNGLSIKYELGDEVR